LFGVSLALGPCAGAIISQSQLSHQAGADILAFRSVLRAVFVSDRHAVNPAFLWRNIGQVAPLTPVVVGKARSSS
jgi:CPA2 family monovalent cation:H+ antiporter-2